MTSTLMQKNYAFFDLEKFFADWGTFLLTLLGAAAAFILNYLPELHLSLELVPGYHVAPITFSPALAVVLFVSAKTKNYVSASVVSISAGLGTIPYVSSNVAFIELYIATTYVTAYVIAYNSSKLRIVSRWSLILMTFTLLYSIWLLQLAYWIRFGQNQEKYWSNRLPVGFGGDGGLYDPAYPTIDLIFFSITLLGTIIVVLRYRSQVVFSQSYSNKVTIFGGLLVLVGQGIAAVTLILWTDVTDISVVGNFAGVKNLEPLQDLFLKGGSFPVVLSPGNVILHAMLSTLLTAIGIVVVIAGKSRGTMSGYRGSPLLVLMSAPIFTFVFIQFGSYPIQDLLYPGGYFINGEYLILYFTVIWSYLFISQVIAYVLLRIFELFKSA